MKTRILETIRQGQIGGGESHVLDLVSNLNRNEFEPIVLSFTNGEMVDRLKALKIKCYVVETLKPFNLRTFNAVKKILIDEQIDILHAHGTRSLSNTLFPAKSLGLPVIYTVHGWSFHQDQKLPVRKVREYSEKFLTEKVDLTISVSNSNQRDGMQRFNMQRSEVVNYGIDLNKFNPNNQFKNLKAELGLDEHKTTVGYLVRMTKQKDPFTMVKAIAEIAKIRSDIQFVFVGDGDLKEQTMSLAKETGADQLIKFHPFRTDVPDVLSNFDIYVLPSLWEGLPIGMLEAMAMKKAVIATPVDGSKEAIQDGVNGYLVPCKDYKQLAEKIISLHLDKSQQKLFGENALKTIQQKFDLKMMVNANENIYRRFKSSMKMAA